MNFINKHLISIAFLTVIISVLWVVFGPIIITQFSIVDFSGGQNNTGVIGDTIGGITSPIVGLTSVILLFLALIKQIEANQISVHEANFRIVYNEIETIRDSAEQFKYKDQFGRKAITQFSEDLGRIIKVELQQNQTNVYYDILKNLEFKILNKFNKAIYLLDNLKTSEQYKDILSKDLQNTYSMYLNDCKSNMDTSWNVTIEDVQGNWLKGKMFGIKKHLNEIQEDVIKRNSNNNK